MQFKAFNRGGRVALNGKNGTTGNELTLVVTNGGDVTMNLDPLTNATYRVYYTVTSGATPTAPANRAACIGHMTATSIPRRIRVPLGATHCINFLVTDSGGSAQNGGAADDVEYMIDT